VLFHDKDAVSKVVMTCRKVRDESTVDTFMIRKKGAGVAMIERGRSIRL
jgi:hypothetical protein